MQLAPNPEFDALIEGTTLQPRNYQQRIVTKGAKFFGDDGVASILVNSPVGSGKTPMGLLIAKALQKRFGCGVGWVAMRQTLLAQAAATNGPAHIVDGENIGGCNIGVDGLTVVSMFDKHPPTRDENGEKIELIVCDEAHHSAAGSMINVMDKVRPRWHLGLSGTPWRSDRVKLCYQKTIIDAGIRQLVDDNYLSQYHKYVIPEWSPACVAERYLAEPERWGQSAMYFRRDEDAMECHRLLTKGGARAGIVLGRHGADLNERNLEAFERGDLDCMVNLFLLTEGWDMPNLKTAWVRDSSRGPTIQMGGRAFRKHKDHPYKQIVQSGKTGYPMDHLVSPSMGYVWTEDKWRSVYSNESVEEMAQAALMVLAHTSPVMPVFISKNRDKGRRRRRRGGGDHATAGNNNRNGHGSLQGSGIGGARRGGVDLRTGRPHGI